MKIEYKTGKVYGVGDSHPDLEAKYSSKTYAGVSADGRHMFATQLKDDSPAGRERFRVETFLDEAVRKVDGDKIGVDVTDRSWNEYDTGPQDFEDPGNLREPDLDDDRDPDNRGRRNLRQIRNAVLGEAV